MSNKKSLILKIVAVVVALAIGAGALVCFNLFGGDDDTSGKKTTSNKKPSSSQTEKPKNDSNNDDDENSFEDYENLVDDDLYEDEEELDLDYDLDYDLDVDIPIMGVPDVGDENDYSDIIPDAKDIITPIMNDDFEGYTDLKAGDAVPGYGAYPGADPIFCTLDDQNPFSGNYSLKVEYDGSVVGWSGLIYSLRAENWYHQDYMSLFVKGDGSPQVMVIGFGNHRKRYTISGHGWQHIKITWEDLGVKDDEEALVGVKDFVIALANGKDRTFWIDDIQILKNSDTDPGKSKIYSEDFEDEFKVADYVADANGGSISLTKDTSNKANGKAGGKVTYNTGSKGYSALNVDLETQAWPVGINSISFNIKGDGTNQTLKFGYTCANSDNFETAISFKSTDWQLVRLMLDDFKGDAEPDITNVTDFYIKATTDEGDHYFYIDDIVFENYIAPSVKTDTFLTMEEGTGGLPDSWTLNSSFQTDASVELSTEEKYEGNYSAKINIPKNNGKDFIEYYVEFDNPIDASEYGTRFVFNYKGDTLTSTQQIRFTLRLDNGKSAATGLINIDSNGNWQQYIFDTGETLSNSDVNRITGIQLLFATYAAPRTFYLDSVKATPTEYVENPDPDEGGDNNSFNTELDTSKPYALYVDKNAAPVIDGIEEEIWADASAAFYNMDKPEFNAKCKILWNETGMYYFIQVNDTTLNAADRFNLWVSENFVSDPSNPLYTQVDGGYFLCLNPFGYNHNYYEDQTLVIDGKYTVAAKNTENSYTLEVYVPKFGKDTVLEEGKSMGFNFSVDNYLTEDSSREEYINWNSDGSYWVTPSALSEVELVKKPAPSFTGSHLTGANWAYKWYTVEFDTPLDLSGSDGTLVFTLTLSANADLHLKPFEIYINGKSLEFNLYETFSGTIKKTIVLEDYGITDEDLKNVTGYFLQLSHGGAEARNFTFKVEAPRAPILPSFKGSHTTGSGLSDYKEYTVEFDTPLDLSGSDGTLVFTHTLSANANLRLKPFEIYINGKTLSFELNETFSGTIKKTIVLADYGITDEDLKNITGYKVVLTNGNGAACDYTFKVEAPRAPLPPSFEASHRTGANWNYKWYTIEFPTPLDMSGSNGTLVITHTLSASADLHLFPFRIYLNGKTLEFNLYQQFSGTITQTIVLADYGITDEDLKNVTGYFIQLSHGGAEPRDYTFKVEAPRAATTP